MKCYHIHIEGQVQGVGFRPFVYRLATQLHVTGWVCNGTDGVHIKAEGEEDILINFCKQLQRKQPLVARITKFKIREIPVSRFDDFRIIESESAGKPNVLITPDIGLCEVCRGEIHDTTNHRFHYPFTTCTQCGPRFSIMRSLPYDREETSMSAFTMCETCEKEYANPGDRRYYSQTNSCPDCAIQVSLLRADGKSISNGWANTAPLLIEALRAGRIVAMKGVGGYLLLADATNSKAIQLLRERKHRASKPFALLYPNLEMLKTDAYVSEKEAQQFLSIQNPIVLVKTKENPTTGICKALIAPGLNRIGVMQPYTAMFELLLRQWNKPLIATSANISSSPIIYKDEDALHSLNSIADYFVVHNREIELAQDDSVVAITPVYKQRIVLRRSRGFAPTISTDAFSDETVLAMGADMKSTFAIQSTGRIYVSQYLGDLESVDSQESYHRALFHLLELLKAKPSRIVVDAHPNYYASQLGKTLAKSWDIPIVQVHHHKAHAFAVLAENNLLETDESILTISWDGTGYGEDKNSWGGEFFEFNRGTLNRMGHIAYTPVWQADKMAKDGRLAALFIGSHSERVKNLLKEKFSNVAWSYFTKLITTTPDLYTSSVGRLFDAVACITGIHTFNSFEGEAAMRLEAEATAGVTDIRYLVKWDNTQLDVAHLLDQIVLDIDSGIPSEKIAFKFHAYLADVIQSVVEAKNFSKIALSGGVFQNRLLIDLIYERLADKTVYIHQELSPNDENISFGQLAYITHQATTAIEYADSEVHLNPFN